MNTSLPHLSISIDHRGNDGNRIFQYLFAKQIEARVEGSELCNFEINLLHLYKKSLIDTSDESVLKVEALHKVDLNQIVHLLKTRTYNHVLLSIFGQRMEYLPEVGLAREWLKLSKFDIKNDFGDDELLINIRAGDIMKDNVHKDYGLLPLSFYEKLLAKEGKRAVFVGQLADNEYTRALRVRFPEARFMPPGKPRADFISLLGARHIVLSVSTFSWMAAWLSPNAIKIHMPLAGFMNPMQRPDVDLLPIDDRRYSFYPHPLLSWIGSDEQIDNLISKDISLLEFNRTDILKIQRRRAGIGP